MRTSRRTFVAHCAAALCSAAGVAHAQMREVRIGYALGERSPSGFAAQAWTESVEKATGTAFSFQHFPDSTLGTEAEMLDAVQHGGVELVVATSGVLRKLVPEVGVLDLPYLFRDRAHARAALDSPWGQELLGRVRTLGLMTLAWGELGFRQLGNNRRAVTLPEALKGLKIGVADNPTQIQAIRALGAAPVTLPWRDLVEALKKGRIDGQDNPLSVFVSGELWEVQSHLSLSAHAYVPLVLIVAPGFWSSLSDTQKAAFTRGARAGVLASRRRVEELEKDALEIVHARGVEVVTELDMAAFRAALMPAHQQYTARFGPQALEQIARVR